ncbi:hypothetical protein F4677DRAFT_449449 [Hypoxylon crocopeplum]|nr:hypothetical protein F4677DRAFT_449449 [Hypoxylon crocopeplum]
MLLPILLISFLASVSTGIASVRVNAGCGFRLTTSGGFNGTVGQLAGGQVRAGSDLSQSLFTWFGDAFADQQGRGCWWTPPTSVLQCDWNQEPAHGFEIGCYGGVSYRVQSTFYECQTGDHDEVNLYLQSNGINCSKVSIHADSCRPPCAGQSSSLSSSTGLVISSPGPTPAMSTTRHGSSQTGTTPTSSQASGTPTHTPGRCNIVIAQGPDEIILIDKGNSDTSYGPNPSMMVQLSPNASAIFVFRFASSDAGKDCALVFDLPSAEQQQYKLTGTGPVAFALLDGPPANASRTTYNNTPRVAMPLEAATLRPGVSIQPLAFPCPGADAKVAFAMGDGPGADTCLEYQQYQPEIPIGMYLVKC